MRRDAHGQKLEEVNEHRHESHLNVIFELLKFFFCFRERETGSCFKMRTTIPRIIVSAKMPSKALKLPQVVSPRLFLKALLIQENYN